ncbi:MAG TPA: quinol:cytochrome C oxidoreductase [Flavobacteriaceae bacterium]|nr:quinol:cytochrome C oxidoreductase [Flavobacteriaceae bacterium]
MYTLSSKLKIFSIVLMVVGLVGLAYSFITVPSDIGEVKEMMASEHGHHGEAAEHDAKENHEISFIDKAQGKPGFTESLEKYPHKNIEESHGDEHWEHVLHQFRAKPWSATFVAAFFFFMIALGALVFYAIQYASQAGWSPVLYRIMEGVTAYLLPGSIIVFLIVIFAGTHFYIWQNEEVMAHDEILQGKSGYLNFPFFVIRIIIYLVGWNLYRFFSRRNSLEQAEVAAGDYTPYKRNFKLSVYFLIFFIITESVMAWDFFMSLTPHWFSTLFAWYVFASLFVSAITTIALITIFLKRAGYLDFVNDSHLHDLAKYVFAFSIFWTYLWFAQFMLIWYANIPEEVTYFIIRIQEYNLLFFGMLVLNFVFPVLMLMNSDYKRIPWFVFLTGIAVLVGHYIDIFLLVMPPTVGPNWFFGIAEIAAICLFLGLFIFVVGTALAKVPLHPKGDPFIKESENYHY